MKKIYKSIFLFLVGVLTSLNINAQTYCAAGATYTGDEDISNVSFASMSNTSACGDVGGGASMSSLYNDYTSLVAAPIVGLGSNYPLSVEVTECDGSSYSGYVGVWIDYNGDGDFLDAGENVFMSASTTFAFGTTVITAPGGITIPATATPGTTRMRVAVQESGMPSSCGTFGWGEVEDYNITILSPSPLDLGVIALLKPLASNKCFGIDTIVTTVRNFGSANVDFALQPTVITVKTTGPVIGTYTLALSTGSIATGATASYTISTSFNMSTLGTYRFKAYTTVVGDGSALNDTLIKNVTKAPYFTTTISPNDTVCKLVPVSLTANYSPLKTVGTGVIVNSSTSYPAPYGNFYWGAKNQFLFLASELSAAGIVAGNINSLSFDATNLNSSAAHTNFTIKIGTSAASSLSAFVTSGLTTFFTSTSYNAVLGLNTHTLSTPYVWDGVSNILIETCFNNSSFSSNVSVKQSNTSFNSSVYYRADAGTVCSAPGSITTSTQRPNISFGQPATVTYSWTPSIGLSSTSIANPIAMPPASQTYTVNANLGGCLSYDTIRITIKTTPTPMLGNDTSVCTLPFILNANTLADNFLWNTGSTSSSISVPTTGTYWVKGTNLNGCSNTDTIKIKLSTFPIVTLGSDTAFCAGKTITLYAGNLGSTFLWNTGATTSTINVGTIGTYSVVVTNTAGCRGSDAIFVTSKSNPTVSLVFGGRTTFCPNETSRLLTEGMPAGGTYIGSGVSGSLFNPSLAGQGTYIIFYTVTAPNGCTNLAKDTLIVAACLGIEEEVASLGLNVIPNPTDGIFTLQVNTSNNIIGEVSITSIDGRVVYLDKIEGSLLLSKTINISDLANGIYYLTVTTKDLKRTYKVLKQ